MNGGEGLFLREPLGELGKRVANFIPRGFGAGPHMHIGAYSGIHIQCSGLEDDHARAVVRPCEQMGSACFAEASAFAG